MTVPDSLGPVELRHLRSFLVIADSETMTQAAATLGISQPSLSAQLTLLEKHVGARLFQRDRHGIRITTDGHRLRDLVLGPVTALHAALVEFGSDGRPVHVVAPADLGPHLRGAVEVAVQRRFPGRSVQWQEMTFPQRAAAVERREAQVRVEWRPLGGDWTVVEGRTLGLLMAADSPLADLDEVWGPHLDGYRVTSDGADDLQRTEGLWDGLFANSWVPRQGLSEAVSPQHLAADPRTVLVAPEPEVADPRLAWRPFGAPFRESCWVALH